jgi:hypothetical protein
MSWKSDIAVLGVIGAGAYLVITNSGKIASWLGDQIGSGLVKPAADAFQAVNPLNPESIQNKAAFEAGQAAGTWTRETIIEPVYNAGVVTGQTVAAANDVFSTIIPNPTEQTLIKGGISAGLFAGIPVLGPIFSGLFNLLAPPSVDKTQTAQTAPTTDAVTLWKQGKISMIELNDILSGTKASPVLTASPSPPASPSPIPIAYIINGTQYAAATSAFGTPAVQIDRMTIPISEVSNINFNNPAPVEVSGYYGRPSFIKEEIWATSVRQEYVTALAAGANPYKWGYEHGFLPYNERLMGG